MGAEAKTSGRMQAIRVPVKGTEASADEHRDWGPETAGRLAKTVVAVTPRRSGGEAECFIPGSGRTVATEDALVRGRATAGLTSTAIGRGVWLLTQKPMMSRLQAAVTALAIVIERCGDGDTCVLNCRQEAEVCDVHFKSFQNWMNRLAAEGLIAKTPKGQEGVEVTLNAESVGCLNVCAAAQDALTAAEEQLEHMGAVQDALLRDSCSRIAEARKTLG